MNKYLLSEVCFDDTFALIFFGSAEIFVGFCCWVFYGKFLFNDYHKPLTPKDTICQVQACLWKSWLMDKGINSSLHPELKLKSWDVNCLLVETGRVQDVKRNIWFVFPDFYSSFPCLCLNVAGGFQGIKIKSCSSSGFSRRENLVRNHKIKYKIHVHDQGSQQWWKAAPVDKKNWVRGERAGEEKVLSTFIRKKGAGLAVRKWENEIRKSNGMASPAPLCQGSAGHPPEFILALSLDIWSYCEIQVILNCWEICN